MSSVTEAWKAWQEGLANKDSSKLGEFFTDDFQFVSKSGTKNRQETLDWTAAVATTTTAARKAITLLNRVAIAGYYTHAVTIQHVREGNPD